MRQSWMFSPPVQPISSITSGTGSLITMWLEATDECVAEAVRIRAVALFTASTAASARTVALAGRRARVAPRAFGPGVRSWSRTPASITFARRPSARRAGWTFAAVGRSTPPRNTGDAHRVATSSRVSGRASSGAPTAAHASTSSSQSPTCASLVATCSVPAAAVPARRRPARRRTSPMPWTARSEARQTSTARVSPTRSRRIGQVVPQRRDEAAVAPARPVPREAGLEHDDVEPGLERLQLPRASRGRGSRRRR